jgi:putative ABC transport system permease protein
VLLIGVPVMLILTLVGITHGFLDDSRRRAAGVGADIIVRPPGSSFGSGTSAPMPATLVDKLAKQPHVALATGVVGVSTGKLFNVLTGIDPVAFDRMSGGFEFKEGHTFQHPREILVDTSYAAEQHLHAGSTLKLQGTNWTVAGIVETGKLSHLFVPMAELQEVTGSTGISVVYLKLDDKKNTTAVVDALMANPKLDGYPIYSMKDWLDLTSVDNISGLSMFIYVVEGIGVFTAFFVVMFSMYMAVLQRTREIGILKSLGATKALVMTLILWEAGATGFGGTLVGIALSFVSRQALRTLVPASLPQAIVPEWWLRAGGIAIAAAFLGAVYPGMKAVRQDPIEALAHE